jgi:cephalosporin hydroxylase
MLLFISKIMLRVWNKITRLPYIGGFMLTGLDKCQGIIFLCQEKFRSEKHKDFNELETPNEYYEFSNRILGAHQIKSEIIGFLEFAKTEQPQYICEIGTADGGTNFLLSQALPSIKLMIGVDLYVKNKAKLQYFCREPQQLVFINGSSYSEITVNKVKDKLAGIKLDILFIDGDHTYFGVKQDFLILVWV